MGSKIFLCPGGCNEKFYDEASWEAAHVCMPCGEPKCACSCDYCPCGELSTCENCASCESCCECVACSECGKIFSCQDTFDEDHMCSNCDKPTCDCVCDNMCEDCGEDPCICIPTRAGALAAWEIPERFELTRACAAFYIRYDMVLVDPAGCAAAFDTVVGELDDLFRRYVDMIIGGEVRHILQEPGGPVAHQLETALEDSRDRKTVSRSNAWSVWKELRMKHGLVALDWAIDAFGERDRSMGGKRWSNIARVLKGRETGELSPTLFVDACFGLEHNSGTFFNKVGWDLGSLKDVLSDVRDGNLKALYYRIPLELKLKHKRLMEVEDAVTNRI